MDLKTYIEAERGRGAALARTLGINPVMVSQWANGVKQVPAERCPSIERATDGAVRCEELRPDVAWDVLREQAHSTKRAAAEPSEAPAATDDPYLPAQDETVKRLERATTPLKRRSSDRDGPGARDERHRTRHAGAGNREIHPR